MITFSETIEAREQDFREMVMTKNHQILMAEETVLNFLDYWTQETTYKRQQIMLWEKREAFDIGKRMAYWKRVNPVKVPIGEQFLNYWSAFYDKKLGNFQKQIEYRKHLKSLGYVFTHSPTAGEIVTPPKS